MEFLEQGVFILVSVVFFGFVFKRAKIIYESINQGRDFEKTGTKSSRMKQMLLIAFGQKKMFKKWIPALLHFSIYAGFLIINLEVAEIVFDGLSGGHRSFLPFLQSIYSSLISAFEILALLVVFACAVFLYRRNIKKVKRFDGTEMTSWPKLDASLILFIEIALMFALLFMNATDQVLQSRGLEAYPFTGKFLISQLLIPILSSFSDTELILVERFCWWFHILGIYSFSLYITYSKHLHIFLAVPATYYGNQNPKGSTEVMKSVSREVRLMLGQQVEETQEPPQTFGAKDVGDLTKKNLLDAYTCTECGRCTEQCPANITGKLLSPRKIMMDTRDRLENLTNPKDESIEKANLLDTHISREELRACTTCNACTEACPINLDPLSIITQLRQYMIMEESSAPAEWNNMFSNIELNQSPWKFPIENRINWTKEED